MLAILLLHADLVVPSDRLIDLIWGESAPPTAATALQGYVSQLRKVIEPDRSTPSVIVTQGSGYVARMAPGQLDSSCFEQLVARGRADLAAGRPQEAADALAEALALWRGPALANVRNEAFAQEPIRRLEELRIAAVENHLDARLWLGRHSEVVAELEGLVSEHPLRERLGEAVGRLLGPARGEVGAPARDKLLEARHVELVGRDARDVARPLGDDHARRLAIGLDRLAQLRHVALQRGRGRRGRRLTPDQVDQPLAGDDLVGVQQQDRQHAALARPAERRCHVPGSRLDRAEEPEVHFPAQSATVPRL